MPWFRPRSAANSNTEDLERVDGSDEQQVADAADDLLPLAAVLAGTPDAAADLLGAAVDKVWRRRLPPAEPAGARAAGSAPGAAHDALRSALLSEYLRTKPAPVAQVGGSAGPPTSERAGGPTVGSPGAIGPALDRLPARSRAVLALSVVEQLTRAGIAALLDRPVKAVGRELDDTVAMLTRSGYGAEELDRALRQLSAEVPSGNAVHRALIRHSRAAAARRRRVRLGVAAAAVLAVLTVLIPTVVLPKIPVFIRRPGQWTFMHTVSPPDGWQLFGRVLTDTQEATQLTRGTGGDTRTCVVSVSLPGTDTFRAGTDALSIRGRPGFYSSSKVERPEGGPYVAWRYADDGWAWVHCDWLGTAAIPDPTREELVALARSVRFERSALRLPLTVGQLPGRYRVHSVVEEAGGRVSLVLAVRPAAGSQVSVSLSFPASAGEQIPVRPATVDLQGRRATLSRDPDRPALCFDIDARAACLTALAPDRRRARRGAGFETVQNLLVAVAGALDFVPDVDDPRTWPEAEKALQG
ncbi:MAG TPA: sigma-70 region 4 domain-containing protein [Propionibacteriaceae bacterium]|nr:sigma-70 region 4 domain-containing protein [Propionibacteriaceae bacterium]